MKPQSTGLAVFRLGGCQTYLQYLLFANAGKSPQCILGSDSFVTENDPDPKFA